MVYQTFEVMYAHIFMNIDIIMTVKERIWYESHSACYKSQPDKELSPDP